MELYTDGAWLVSLVVALAIGAWIGPRGRKLITRESAPRKSPPTYYQSLSSLIDDSTDDTILDFIQALPVSSDSLSVHLALARQLRRHGLAERALAVHERLLDSTYLTREDKHLVRNELAIDYEIMGLFDRAVELLSTVIEQSGSESQRHWAVGALVKLYAKEGEWGKAVSTAQGLSSELHGKMRVELAHYWCELADQQMVAQDVASASSSLKSALEQDAGCARASLLRAQLLMNQTRWPAAIGELKRVSEQQRNLFGLALPALARCYREIGEEKTLESFLERCMVQTPTTSLLLALVELKRRTLGERAAKRYLTERLRDYPSLRGACTLLELEISDQPAPQRSMYALQQVLTLLERNTTTYRCRRCGYESQQMHWQCPSCRNWSSIEPVVGVAGE